MFNARQDSSDAQIFLASRIGRIVYHLLDVQLRHRFDVRMEVVLLLEMLFLGITIVNQELLVVRRSLLDVIMDNVKETQTFAHCLYHSNNALGKP